MLFLTYISVYSTSLEIHKHEDNYPEKSQYHVVYINENLHKNLIICPVYPVQQNSDKASLSNPIPLFCQIKKLTLHFFLMDLLRLLNINDSNA